MDFTNQPYHYSVATGNLKCHLCQKTLHDKDFNQRWTKEPFIGGHVVFNPNTHLPAWFFVVPVCNACGKTPLQLNKIPATVTEKVECTQQSSPLVLRSAI